MVAESRPAHIANFLIAEQLHNEEVERALWSQTHPGDPVSEHLIQERRRLLIESLARQCPQFVNFAPNGNFSRALVYRSDHQFQAYIEAVSMQDPDGPKKIRGEYFSGDSAQSIQQEISWFNRQHGTTRDLLQEPDSIFLRFNQPGGEEYLHFGNYSGEPVIVYAYSIHPMLPPRSTGVWRAESFWFVPKDVVHQEWVPMIVKQYAQNAFAA